jgi:hypothetical protein
MVWENIVSSPTSPERILLPNEWQVIGEGLLVIRIRSSPTAAGVTVASVNSTGGLTGTLTNVASTSAVCYNTSTGLLTYDSTIGTCNTSTIRVKHDIRPLADMSLLDGVLRMKPVSFYYNADQHTNGQQLGLIAEDLAAIDPRLVAYDDKGRPNAIRFLGPMFSYVIGAIKELKADNDNLREDISQLKRATR